jgi:hypothetical protein
MTHIGNLVVFVRLLALFPKMNAPFRVYLVLKWFDMPLVFQVCQALRRFGDPMKCWIGVMLAKSVIGRLKHSRSAPDKKSLLLQLSFMILTW